MLRILIIHFALIALILCATTTFDTHSYCDPSLCRNIVQGGQHIACNWTDKFGAHCPQNTEKITMTPELIDLIVNTHNERRNYVAGGNLPNHSAACRMATMKWDPELAFLANIASSKCDLTMKNFCTNTKRFAFSGEAVAKVSLNFREPTERIVMRALEIFYSKHKESNMKIINKYSKEGSHAGLFTLMVVERNVALGCGLTKYACEDDRLCYLFVCNYATTNFVDHPIYSTCELPASACIRHHNPRYPNLCNPSEEYVINSFL